MRSRRRRLMATNAGPWVVMAALLAVIVAAIILIVLFVVPPLFGVLGIELPQKATPTPAAPTPTPTPTPHAIESAHLPSLQKEIVANLKYLSHPYYYDGKILFSGGTDEAGGPKMNNLYLFDPQTNEKVRVETGELAYDDIFYAQMNADYIIWLDHSREGGGNLMALRRSNGETFLVKRYYVGQPRPVLEGSLVCWTERTGSYMDKVFLYDLDSRENAAVATLSNSPFGQSDCHMGGGELVWAVEAPSDGGEARGAIASVRLDSSGQSGSLYTPGTYVHDPMTNGEALIWSDSNHETDAALYISVNRGAAKKIANDVIDYSLGSNFVAYTVGQELHIYFYGERTVDKVISLEGENCSLINVSNDTAFWYDTGVGSKDILKYAPIS